MKVAIFDFDGTLFDSAKYWTKIINDYLQDNGIDVPKDVFSIVKPLGIRGAVTDFNERFGFKENVDEIVKNWRGKMGVNYHKVIPLKKYSVEYLDKLKKSGIKICLATAMEKDFVEGAIDRCDIRKYFDYIVTIEDVKADKNTPKIFEHCAKKYNASNSECTVYEDNPKTVKMCHEAGFKVIGVYDGVCKSDIELMKPFADKFIYEFDELLV